MLSVYRSTKGSCSCFLSQASLVHACNGMMACPYSHDRTCQLASQRISCAAADSATCFATGIMLQIAANSPSLMRGAWERALKTLCDVYTRMTFIQLDKCVHVFIAFLTSMLHRAATHRFCRPIPTIFFPHLVELDVVGREQARLAAKVTEPPVVVGEFLGLNVSKSRHRIAGCVKKLTMPVIFPPSGKLSSLSSAAS